MYTQDFIYIYTYTHSKLAYKKNRSRIYIPFEKNKNSHFLFKQTLWRIILNAVTQQTVCIDERIRKNNVYIENCSRDE